MEFYRELNQRNLIKYVKKLIGSVNHAQNLLKHMFTNNLFIISLTFEFKHITTTIYNSHFFNHIFL